MIPHLNLLQRVVAWLLWRLEGFDHQSMDCANWYVMEHPDYLTCASLLRDYWYIRNAREHE